MRMLMNVTFPHEIFNKTLRDGSIDGKMERIMAELKPEAVYFTEQDGQRGVFLVVNMDNPSQVPAFAEPWFLLFNADVKFRIVMTPEDLKNAGLAALGKKWG